MNETMSIIKKNEVLGIWNKENQTVCLSCSKNYKEKASNYDDTKDEIITAQDVHGDEILQCEYCKKTIHIGR